MKRVRIKHLIGVLLLISSALFANTSQAEDKVIELPEYRVTAQETPHPQTRITEADLTNAPTQSMENVLGDIPGVQFVRFGADSLEPSIRGLGSDWLTTSIQGLVMPNYHAKAGASLGLFVPASLGSVVVYKSLPSVTAGPATIGGRIALAPPDLWAESNTATGQFGASYDSNRKGFTSQGWLQQRSDSLAIRTGYQFADLGNYTSGDGSVADSKYKVWGGSTTASYQPDKTSQLDVSMLYTRQDEVDNIALPLDTHDAWAIVGLAAYKKNFSDGDDRQLSWQFGYSHINPYLTNAARSVKPMLIYNQARVNSFNAGLSLVSQINEADTITIGADYNYQDRSSIRYRNAPSGLASDHIWPDVYYHDVGLNSEWTHRFAPFTLRTGARLDLAWSDALDADLAALGKSVRDQYITYTGQAAGNTRKRELAGAANILLDYEPSPGIIGSLGLGLTKQPAPATERYRAFLDALGGGYELGNPALQSPIKAELAAGILVRQPLWELNLDAFAYHIQDYVYRMPVGTTTAPPPPVPGSIVYSYRNIDAVFYGAEAALTLRPTTWLSLPTSFTAGHGYNKQTGVRLPDIPPWELQTGLRLEHSIQQWNGWVAVNSRLVGSRSNPAPQDNPLYQYTPTFRLWDLNWGISYQQRIRLEITVDNLLNLQYHEYLSPRVNALGSNLGTLRANEPLPGVGRTVTIAVRVEF